ncbi:MAG: hypothetical protein AUJ06_00060 [Chloroflexi bacterium 13_1_40CM_3_70_6]|nr:MAG: hypothetical protein AUJ06_00060 [Chloroflexi bacterium 13_1_40CM_3_70_6]
MAIRAAHFAFVYLGLYPLPAPATVRVGRDVGELFTDMIEFEHDDVGLSAVDARVTAKVCNDPSPHFVSPLGDLPR